MDDVIKKSKLHESQLASHDDNHCCRNSEETNHHGWRNEEINARVSTRLARRANSGLRYRSSSILVSSSAMHINLKLHTLTVLGNTCNLLVYYASTFTLYVDLLQARPTKRWGRRSRYDKICYFYMYSYHRAYNAYWYFVVWARLQQYAAVYTWHCAQSTRATCSIFGTAITLYSSSVQNARNIIRLFLDKTHAVRRYIYPCVRLAFRRGECLYIPQGVGRWAV